MAARLRPLSLLAALGLASGILLSSAQPAHAQAPVTARRSGTFTLLADGSVLLIGGLSDEDEDGGADPGPAPVYLGAAAGGVQRLNENKGRVENVATMAVNRASHTATLLPDGRVLVVGGINAGGALNSFTIYEPIYNNWIAAADLPNLGVLPSGARYNHTATLTKNGKVFICGGQDNANNALSSCDIFTPGYGPRGALNAPGDAIAAAGLGKNLLDARTNHTASLLFNGDILVAGGYDPAELVDGSGANAWSKRYLNSAERFTTDPVYCPSDGCWVGAGALSTGRAYHTATTMADGKVLIAGGNYAKNEEANRGYLNTTEIYDPMSDTFADGPPMTSRKASFAAALRNNGSVVIQGGLGNIPTSYFTPEATVAFESYISGPPGAAGCTNPANYLGLGLPYCDLGFESSTAAVTSWGVNLAMLFELDFPVTGFVEEGVALFYNPRIEFLGGSAMFNSGYVRNDGTYAGTRGLYNGANVYCAVNGSCGWAYLGSMALIFDSGNYATFPVLSDNVTGTDPAGCIDFVGSAAGIGAGSPPATIRNGREADSPVYAGAGISYAGWVDGTNTCPGGFNSWAGNLTVVGFPINTVGGRISSGTILLQSVGGTNYDAVYDTTYDLTISSMFAVIPRGTLIWETIVAGQRVGAVTFTANYRDINGTVSSDTDVTGPPNTGPVSGSISIVADSVYIRYVVDRIDIGSTTSLGTFSAGPLESWAITRSMIFADFDEFDSRSNTWRRVPLVTSGLDSKFSHSAVVTRSGDLRFWGGRTCDYINRVDCRDRQVFTSTATLWTYQAGWTQTDNTMRDGRGNHTATVLPGTGGKILVAGGTNGPSVLKSSELYDPATRRFTPTGEMKLARDLHTASLLPNGKVLVAGGYAASATSTGPTNTAEIYYPREGVWRDTGVMRSSRDAHVALTLPDGNILVFGGYSKEPVSAGNPNGPYLDRAEIYYSTTGKWISIPSVTDANTAGFRTLGAGGTCNGENPRRSKHTGSLMKNGEILFAGGFNDNGTMSSALLLNLYNTNRTLGWYCAAQIRESNAPNIVRYVHSHSALALPDGDILLTFGNDGAGQAEQPPLALSYNPEPMLAAGGGTWTSSVGRNQKGVTYNHAAVLLPGGNPVIVGGARGQGQPQRGTMYYDRLESTFTSIGNMVRSRAWHTVTLTLGEELVVIGGFSNGAFVNDAEYYPITISNPPDFMMSGYPPSVRLSSITSVDAAGGIYSPGFYMTARDKNLSRMTEAATGGHANSSNFHPRMVMQAVDTSGGTGSQGTSGFYIDLTSRVYHSIAGAAPLNGYSNPWTLSPNIFGSETVNSSITVRLPETSNTLPNGWYNLRIGQNGLYSESMLMRVGPSLPDAPGTITGSVLSSTAVFWSWNFIPGSTNLGYNIYFSSSGGYITSVTTPTPGVIATYMQGDLTPNVTAAIIVEGFSQTGDGPGSTSGNVFTLSTVPVNIRYSTITTNGAVVVWDANNNSNATVYEIAYALNANFDNVVTPTDELPALTTTTFELKGLTALTSYYLRIRSKNLAGQYSVWVTTTLATKWDLISLTGSPCNAASAHTCIDWTWSTSTLAGFVNSYNIYNATIPSTAPNYRMNAAPIPLNTANYTDGGSAPPWLKPNAARVAYLTGVRPDGQEWPLTLPTTVYTYAAPPAQQPGQYHVVGGSASITVQWNTNGNPALTIYNIYFATRNGDGAFVWSATSTFQTVAGSVFMKQMIPDLAPSEMYHASMSAVNEAGVESFGSLAPDTFWGTYDLDPAPPARSTHSAVTLANRPDGLQIINTTPDSVTITWEAGRNSSSTTYEVSWSTDNPLRAPPAPPIYVAPSYDSPGSRAFSERNNSLSCTITGLMTGTTYWFRVQAQNFDGVKTPEYSPSVSTRTPTGSASATTGQLGGELRAAQDTTITGTIGAPAVRTVSLTAPAGAFSTNVEVVISTYNVSGAASLCSDGVGIGLSIVPIPYIQPVKPLSFTFSYTAAELGGADPAKIVLMRYDPSKGKCVPLPTVVDTVSLKITALINHLSLFQLATVTTPTNPHNAKVFPNPFYKSRDGYVSFTNMPPYSRIRIYTVQGDLILDRLATGAGMLDWGGLNMWGRMVASGMYLAVIQYGNDKKIMKVVVLR